MAVGKRELVLGAIELAFERSSAAQKIGLPLLLHYFELRLPHLFDGRTLALARLWDELSAEEGVTTGDLAAPLLALKTWEALFGVLVEMPDALDKVDFDERKRAVATLGIQSNEAAKLIADRAERSAAPAPLSVRRRVTEVLQAMDTGAAPAAAQDTGRRRALPEDTRELRAAAEVAAAIDQASRPLAQDTRRRRALAKDTRLRRALAEDTRLRRALAEAPTAPHRRASAELATTPARRVTASRERLESLDRRRPLILALGGALGVAALIFAYFQLREPPAKALDTATLRTIVELERPQQRGVHFVAVMTDPRWAGWAKDDRKACVRKLLDRLAISGVLVVTLVDPKGVLLAQGNSRQNQIQVFGP